MPTYQERTIVKSYKLRIKNKFKSLVVDTENVVSKLRSYVSVFNQRLEELLTCDDEYFLSQYPKLNVDFENHQEMLFYLLASIDNTTTVDNEGVSEGSCYLDVDVPISPDQPFDPSSSLRNFSNALQSQTSITSSYCSVQDYSETNQIQLVLNNKHENNPPGHEFDFRQSNKSISHSSYRSLSSDTSCNQLSISSNLLDLSVSRNTEVKQLELNDPCSNLQTENVLFSLPLPVNAVISATLTHILNPSDFWMQLKNSDGYKISFSKFEFIEESPPPYIREGDLCLAPFKSLPYYYRAEALNEAFGHEDVEVFFIDYGSTQKVPLVHLRSLPRSAYEISAQAFHCELFNISPINGVWTYDSIEKLKEFQNNSIQAHIKSVTCDKYAVQLITTVSGLFSEDFFCDIGDALCLDGLAVSDMAPQSDQGCCNSTKICNQASCDSGVSVTSYKQSSPSVQNVSCSSDVAVNNLVFESTETVNVLQSKDDQMSDLMTVHQQDLISFDSIEEVHDALEGALSDGQDECAFLFKKCLKNTSCDCALHLSVPTPYFSFVEKNMMLVMISDIVTPSEFYVNLAMEESFTLDELQEQMSALYESQPDSCMIKVDDLKEGMVCAGRYDLDCNWYRVAILKVHSKYESSCDVYVQYIDYGNKAVVKHDSLRPLLPKFAKHPSFAIKCSLSGIIPKHKDMNCGDNDSKCWSKEAVQKFHQLTSFDRCLTAQICESRFNLSTPIGPLRSAERPIQVLLWDTKGTKDLLINEALVECGLAEIDSNFASKIQLDYTISSQEKAVFKHWDPMNEEFNDIENSYGVHVDDAEVAISGYKQNDESYACKYFSLRGHCPRGDRCPYQHVALGAGGVTRDQEEAYSLDLVPSLPNPSSHVLIEVSAVINPGLFYSVLPFGSKGVDQVDSLVHRGASYETLLNYRNEIKVLCRAMNQHYNNSPFDENTAVALAFGSIVAAWRKEDNSWHRARIIDVSDISGPSKVFFVDFGDEYWVPRRSIRKILPEYLHTPFQAIECHLSDVEPLGYDKGKNWSQQAVSRFKELLSYQVMLAHITFRCGKTLHLTLRNTTQENHENLGDILVREGFAQFQTMKATKLKESMYVPG